MKTWYFIIDVEKCENCNNCFLSCKDEHADNDWPGFAAPMPTQGPSWIAIPTKERGSFPFIDVAYLPSPCMHCEDAPCMKAAEGGAIYRRDDGIVIIDPKKAGGQKKLVNSCPYGAIQWNDKLNLPQKCTLCAHLLDKGWEKTRCVQSCPTGALSMCRVEPSEMKKMVEAEKLEPFKPGLKTNPHVLYKNLYRFTRCFIGGSVARAVNGLEECVKGAAVTLVRGSETIGECVTDEYGDFKFDNLERGSGVYTVKVHRNGHGEKAVTVDLKESANVGVVYLS